MKQKHNMAPEDKRNHVIVTKVTQQEYKNINEKAAKCGMTTSSFARARMLGYQPKCRLTEEEFARLGTLEACRTDMVRFANALSGLTHTEKLALFRNYRQMFEWYSCVAPVTNAVTDFLKSVQHANSFKQQYREQYNDK